jgi:hypothetical protein
MFLKREPKINELFLLNILNQDVNNMSKNNILMKCQSITSNNYCNYIHKHGKNKDLICGIISKNKNSRCYTHSRSKNKYHDKNDSKIKLKVMKVIKKSDENINLKNETLIFKKLYNLTIFKQFNNIYHIKEIFFKSKLLFIFPKYIYDVIFNFLFIVEKNRQNIKLLEFAPNKLNNSNALIKKKKKTKKIKKIIKLNENTDINIIKEKIEITLCTFDMKVPKDEMAGTLHILLKENKKLFKVYINIILSNIDIFFENIDNNAFDKIWNNNIKHIQYEHVLIYSDNDYSNIIEKVFVYVRNNYNSIPQHVKVLWVDYNNNNIIMYEKKYYIDNNKTGIKIYNKNDTKKVTPLPLDKITVLYY